MFGLKQDGQPFFRYSVRRELIDGQVSQGKELERYEMNGSDKRYSVHFRLESAAPCTIQTTVPKIQQTEPRCCWKDDGYTIWAGDSI